MAYELLCRVEEYHRLRSCLRRAVLVECRPDRLLRWRSVDGPVRSETMLIQPVSSQRTRITVDCVGPGELSGRLGNDLAQLKLYVEAVSAAAGPRERAARSNDRHSDRIRESSQRRNAAIDDRRQPTQHPDLHANASPPRRYSD
jgi:hypothetical protein